MKINLKLEKNLKNLHKNIQNLNNEKNKKIFLIYFNIFSTFYFYLSFFQKNKFAIASQPITGFILGK